LVAEPALVQRVRPRPQLEEEVVVGVGVGVGEVPPPFLEEGRKRLMVPRVRISSVEKLMRDQALEWPLGLERPFVGVGVSLSSDGVGVSECAEDEDEAGDVFLNGKGRRRERVLGFDQDRVEMAGGWDSSC
jgi:hypothetical protein